MGERNECSKNLFRCNQKGRKNLKKICTDFKVKPNEVAYIGDDVNDIGLLKLVGLSATPNDGNFQVKKIVDYVCKRNSGTGVLRELIDKILLIKNSKKIDIGTKFLKKMVMIIAEIGINHNGDIDIAKKLIDIAKSAGCDAVKFQKRDVEKVYSKKLLDSPRDSPWGKTQREQKLGLEFSEKEYEIIDNYCKKKKIDWFLSCWDVGSQIKMRKFKTKYNKIASAMLVHEKLLHTVAEEKKHTHSFLLE